MLTYLSSSQKKSSRARAQPDFEKNSLSDQIWAKLSKTEPLNTSPTPSARGCAVWQWLMLWSGAETCTRLVDVASTYLVLKIGAVLVICQSPGQTSWRRCVAMSGCMCEGMRLNVLMAGAPTFHPTALPQIYSWLRCMQLPD